jgi:hypothetical protein
MSHRFLTQETSVGDPFKSVEPHPRASFFRVSWFFAVDGADVFYSGILLHPQQNPGVVFLYNFIRSSY